MAPLKLDVLIVGGGIGGMTAAIACKEKGFNVTILESQAQFTHIGAGLAITSNASRVLCDMGLKDSLDKVSIPMARVVFMRSSDGLVIDEKSYEGMDEQLGAPLWQIHRADLHDVLYAKALELNVNVQMGAKVAKFDSDAPSATLEDGTVLQANVIIAADGYRSRARAQLLGEYQEPRFSGFSAFRAVIPRTNLEDDPELAKMLDTSQSITYVWVGGGCHTLCYPIRQGSCMNIVLNQPALHTKGPKYVAPAKPNEIAEIYKDWDPRLVRMINRIPEDSVLEWKLCDLAPMDSWIFPGGKIALLGDACHAMLPSAAQGAGMGIEDGAAVAELLARATHESQIPAVLKTYEKLRLPRCSWVVDSGRENAKKWHKEDAQGGTVTDDMWMYDVKSDARGIEIVAV